MTDQIEVPVRSDSPLSKYLARIQKDLFLKARTHCDRKGISLNTLITLALRDYLQAGEIEVSTQPKLSQVFKDELAAMEARLLAVLAPPDISIGATMQGGHLPTGLSPLNVKAAPAGEGAGLGHVPEHWKTAPPGHGQSDTGILDWDSPAPHNRLFPDDPPVKGSAPEPLRGQVWVVTGDFDTMTTSRVREILQQAGAIVAATVNKKTSAVLAGSAGEGEKLDAAEGYSIPIWNELQFLHMARFIGADVRIPV